MQKTIFMASMIAMQDMSLNVGTHGLALTRQKDEEGKIIKSAEKEGKEVLKLAEELFVNVQKSIRAFFMKDDQKYNLISFEENLGVFSNRNHVYGSEESVKGSLMTIVAQLENEMMKHESKAKVFHDSGAVWKKNKNDLKRFDAIKSATKNISKIVS
jgi:hypothetical protein